MSQFSVSPEALVNTLQGWPPECLWLISLLVCFGSLLCLLRLFGPAGVYTYMVVAIIVANIQVLKAVEFSVLSTPIALGTLLFTSTFLATDILVEYYGVSHAKRGVYLGFAGLFLATVLYVITLGFQPLDPTQTPDSLLWAVDNHQHMQALFMPAPALFIAGMVAYLTSQLYDVWLYRWILGITGRPMLWFRNNVSTALSCLIDNTIFSILAWVILAEQPLEWSVVVKTYILGAWGLRILIAILDTPFLYLAKYCLPTKKEPLN